MTSKGGDDEKGPIGQTYHRIKQGCHINNNNNNKKNKNENKNKMKSIWFHIGYTFGLFRMIWCVALWNCHQLTTVWSFVPKLQKHQHHQPQYRFVSEQSFDNSFTMRCSPCFASMIEKEEETTTTKATTAKTTMHFGNGDTGNNNNVQKNNEQKQKKDEYTHIIDDIQRPRKQNTLTVCIVPPPSAMQTWEKLTEVRTKWKDPGLYRWPPHVNLLYPFVSVRRKEHHHHHQQQQQRDGNFNNFNDSHTTLDKEVLFKIAKATQKIAPFQVSLTELGTFGNDNRGVLWLYPKSSYLNYDGKDEEEDGDDDVDNNNDNDESAKATMASTTSSTTTTTSTEPIIELHSQLENEFQVCAEVLKSRNFVPHMSVGHFISIDKANEAKEQLYKEEWQSISSSSKSSNNDNINNATSSPTTTATTFLCDCIYLLERQGDDGQFQRIATFRLGGGKGDIEKQELNGETTTTTTNVANGASIDNDDETVFSDAGIIIHPTPLPFPDMPTKEEEWVKEERLKLKGRRNHRPGNRKRGPRPGGGRRRRRKRLEAENSSMLQNSAATNANTNTTSAAAETTTINGIATRTPGIWQSQDSLEEIEKKRAERRARRGI